MKSIVYKEKVDNRDKLLDHIMDVITCIKERQVALTRATIDVLIHIAKSTDSDGGIFENVLC
jgi:hypothetical protein